MAEATAQATRNVITLKGSTAVVTEFFEFAVSRYATPGFMVCVRD